ncbi:MULTISPECIES: hypothetical protein [Desulfofundulus]|jgi:hypothetical protein|uniref:Uncharacterized protein n=1 Tax=Desulfofundulus australicus DSM 11792 TaxID=1121425 RepID=A0A1M4UPA8_9FIRM|nr:MULTISPECIES: hypothetical protein [Desulfofundulus]MBE3585627.1 hypothetical protein [Thermoanaerobacter sp.]MCS5696101.1 hypothetical protein [Desulfofundulus thermocisternus]MDK2887178.1 hypothetical protein [Thermoanaerobacter sp.]SHE58430.1 hypothetical protein SAMN02745218_00526 [Desulfofundulus australicus DSM 11792]
MGIPRPGFQDEEIKRWLNHIALICLSEEFQELKKELEQIYRQSEVENYALAAFVDALYAFVAQEEENLICQSGTL